MIRGSLRGFLLITVLLVGDDLAAALRDEHAEKGLAIEAPEHAGQPSEVCATPETDGDSFLNIHDVKHEDPQEGLANVPSGHADQASELSETPEKADNIGSTKDVKPEVPQNSSDEKPTMIDEERGAEARQRVERFRLFQKTVEQRMNETFARHFGSLEKLFSDVGQRLKNLRPEEMDESTPKGPAEGGFPEDEKPTPNGGDGLSQDQEIKADANNSDSSDHKAPDLDAHLDAHKALVYKLESDLFELRMPEEIIPDKYHDAHHHYDHTAHCHDHH